MRMNPTVSEAYEHVEDSVKVEDTSHHQSICDRVLKRGLLGPLYWCAVGRLHKPEALTLYLQRPCVDVLLRQCLR